MARTSVFDFVRLSLVFTLFSPGGTLAGAWISDLPSSATQTVPQRFALLVGVQGYPNLEPGERLRGSCNDVDIMWELLTSPRFGFPEGNVVVLKEEQATSIAIRAELANLISRVRALPENSIPAEVVFHFSGHGSFVPDQPGGDPDSDEPDGYDETIVPYDATKQGGPEDIRDDELNQVAERICADGRGHFFVVLDCCHAGTGARGVTKTRCLERNKPGQVPRDGKGGPIALKELPTGAVLLAACRANERTPEYEDAQRTFGLMTRFFVQVINERQDASQLTYRMLRDAVIARYEQAGIPQRPTPQLEGKTDSLNQAIFGVGVEADRPAYWEVASISDDRSGALVKAGSFHGVTVGSIFELYAKPDDIVWNAQSGGHSNGPSLLWLRIVRVEGASAKARVFQWERGQNSDVSEVALPRDFQKGFAVERFHDHGDIGMRIRVENEINEHSDGIALADNDIGVPPCIRQSLLSAVKEGEAEWLTWVDGDAPCDCVLRIDGNMAAIFPSTGRGNLSACDAIAVGRSTAPLSLRGGWGPIDLSNAPRAARDLAKYLRQITRARNLVRLASVQSENDNSPVKVNLELIGVKTDDNFDVTSREPWQRGGEDVFVMNRKDQFTLRITNCEPTGKPVYVTLFCVDPNMEIQCLLPIQQGDKTEVVAGESLETEVYYSDEPPGLYHAVLLATREPNDFCLLAQPALPTVKGREFRGGLALGELLLNEMYFCTRGPKRLQPRDAFDESWSARVISWDAK